MAKKEKRIGEKNWKDIKPLITAKRDDEETEAYSEAQKTCASIIENVRRGGNGFYCGTTHYSGLVGILAISTGEMKEAERIYSEIERQVKRDPEGMYGERSAQVIDNALDSAIIGILAAKLGQPGEAKKIMGSIEKMVPKGRHGLYSSEPDGYSEYAYVNAAIGVLAFVSGDKEKAQQIYEIIDENVRTGEHGLYFQKIGEPRHEFGENQLFESADVSALIGTLAACTGRMTEAKALYSIIGKSAMQNLDRLASDPVSSDYSIDLVAAVGILAAAIGRPGAWK